MKTDNELIAEFMGGRIDLETGSWHYLAQKEGHRALFTSNLKYNTSWDWLMPVVEKIAGYRMAYPKESAWVCDCKIVVYKHLLYREVVNFIKFYNANPSKQ